MRAPRRGCQCARRPGGPDRACLPRAPRSVGWRVRPPCPDRVGSRANRWWRQAARRDRGRGRVRGSEPLHAAVQTLPRDDTRPVPGVPKPLGVQDKTRRAHHPGASDSKEEPMRARIALAITALLLALPATAAGEGGVLASASGGVHWTIPLPNDFGVEVVNQPLSFTARKYADGSVDGHFTYHQIVEGQSFNFGVDVTCLVIYDGNRAKIGGEIETSNDPTLPPGSFAWVQVFDNGEGANAPPDRSSLIGFGDEAANEAFCNSPNLPRFGPWDVHGTAQVNP